MKERINERMNKGKDEWKKGWITERMKERMNKGKDE